MPVRVQRKRSKGWKMPQNTVYVGRPTKWGNPFNASILGNEAATAAFKHNVCANYTSIRLPRIMDIKSELRGKNLACWCLLNQPCHADVLLEIANAGDNHEQR